MQVSVDDLKEAGLVVRGRTGRGRTYEVKQPAQRLGELLAQYQPGLKLRVTQGELFTSEGETILYDIPLVDLVHLVIGLAQAGESVVPWLERFAGLRSQLGAALRYVRDIRADWKEPIDRVLALIEGATADHAISRKLNGWLSFDRRADDEALNPVGIEPHPNRKGFLDYLRELRQDDFPFQRGYKLAVVGLEDVLLAAGNKLPEVEEYIHRILVEPSERAEFIMGSNVQVIFEDKLQKSNDFWIEAGLQKHLSLRRIFGNPSRQQGPNGTEFFFAGFNLT